MRSVALVLVAYALSACATATSLSTNPAGKLVYPGSVLTSQQESFGDQHEVDRAYSVPGGTTVEDVFTWYEAQLLELAFRTASEPTMYANGQVAQLFNSHGATRLDVGVKLAPADRPVWANVRTGQPAPAAILRLEPSQVTVSISGD